MGADAIVNGQPTVADSNIWEAEGGVACEKCHGPGADHAASMSKEDIINPDDLVGNREGTECTSCHQSIRPATIPSALSSFQAFPCIFNETNPLAEGEMFTVGQNPDEFYVWNERQKWLGTDFFRRSKTTPMDQARGPHSGLKCATCHDPHSQQLRADEPALCLSCHDDAFDTASHEMVVHDQVQCSTCHTPWPKHSFDRSRRHDARLHDIRVPTPSDSLAGYDILALIATPGFVPTTAQEEEIFDLWTTIQGLDGACYDNSEYPLNMDECTQFDIMPNGCSGCRRRGAFSGAPRVGSDGVSDVIRGGSRSRAAGLRVL